MPNAKLARRRERADVICEALRALDATGMTSSFDCSGVSPQAVVTPKILM